MLGLASSLMLKLASVCKASVLFKQVCNRGDAKGVFLFFNSTNEDGAGDQESTRFSQEQAGFLLRYKKAILGEKSGEKSSGSQVLLMTSKANTHDRSFLSKVLYCIVDCTSDDVLGSEKYVV